MDPSVTFIEDIEGAKIGLAYGLMIFEVHKNSSTIPHKHASSELWIVLSGKGVANYNDINIQLSAGSQLTVNPNSVHFIKNESDEPIQILAMWWREANGKSAE